MVRIPFDWARFQPNPTGVDRDVIEQYHALLEASPLPVWASLFEGEVPGWFDDAGHFADTRAAGRWWPRFVELIADEFGDAIAGWVPIDRPVQFARSAFAEGRWPPNRRDPIAHRTVDEQLVIAWRNAWRILKGAGRPVLVSLDLERVLRIGTRPDDVAAERRREQLVWELWPRALRDGVIEIGSALPIPDLAQSGAGIMAWLPAPGPAADWSAELLRRLATTVDLPLHPVVRLGSGDLGQAEGALAGAVHDALGIETLWCSPALMVGTNDGLVDLGGVATEHLERWQELTRTVQRSTPTPQEPTGGG
jgi:hypothetical protein